MGEFGPRRAFGDRSAAVPTAGAPERCTCGLGRRGAGPRSGGGSPLRRSWPPVHGRPNARNSARLARLAEKRRASAYEARMAKKRAKREARAPRVRESPRRGGTESRTSEVLAPGEPNPVDRPGDWLRWKAEVR